jgi:hypothetical protein
LAMVVCALLALLALLLLADVKSPVADAFDFWPPSVACDGTVDRPHESYVFTTTSSMTLINQL